MELFLALLESYGWLLIILPILIYFLYPKIKAFLDSSAQTSQAKKYDTNDAIRREEAMLAARLKLQQGYDQKVEIFKEQMAKREEEKAETAAQEWEKHKEGKGYRSKTRFQDSPLLPTGDKLKTKTKKPLRSDDYNPLMGSGGSGNTGYRPSGRSFASGGG